MNTKVCFKCGKEKDIDDFYVHRQMADGHLNKCKECAKLDVSHYYRTHRDRCATYEHERAKLARRKACARIYQRRRRRLCPQKYVANNAVRNAIYSGRLIRQPCEVCGDLRSQAHHEDYAKPLDVKWLCRKHHLEAHGKMAYELRPDVVASN